MINGTKTNLHIDNYPLRERIADKLRELIVEAHIKPGDPIIEMDLATQLGVSRAPLREALQILNSEGLIEVIPYHKTTVRNLTRRDITELYSLRSALESLAMRQIIKQGDPQSIAVLEAHYEEMLAAADNGEAARASALDHQFHTTMIMLSNNKLLIKTWGQVSQRVRQVLALRDPQRTDIRKIARSHRVLIDAIIAGDTHQSDDLCEAHIMDASALIVKIWDDDEQGY
jgi:DNA-binding GntR family transcriptional regulator